MGLMDKVKKILFDEEDIEIPVNSDELPERELRIVETVKKDKSANHTKKSESPVGGFRNYHYDDLEEDTIKEIKLPKEEEEIEAPEKRMKFPIDDFDFEEELPSRSSFFEEDDILEETKPNKNLERIHTTNHYDDFKDSPKKEVPREEKDYRKIISETDDNDKKPFTVTPIISPVYGILDKNYKQEEVAEKRNVISQLNSGAKPRLYGPVSYNDKPLPKPHIYMTEEEKGLKEELVELNSTISELINDSVTSENFDDAEIELPIKIAHDESEEHIEDSIEDRVDESFEAIEDDEIIATENYDEITSGIENEYIDNNNIEDAFDATSEFDQIVEEDKEIANIEPLDDIDEISSDSEDEHLDDTIETDLFNLIDSMYKSDDEEEEE